MLRHQSSYVGKLLYNQKICRKCHLNETPCKCSNGPSGSENVLEVSDCLPKTLDLTKQILVISHFRNFRTLTIWFFSHSLDHFSLFNGESWSEELTLETLRIRRLLRHSMSSCLVLNFHHLKCQFCFSNSGAQHCLLNKLS